MPHTTLPQHPEMSLMTYHIQMAEHHDLSHHHHNHQPPSTRSGASSRTAMFRGTLGSSANHHHGHNNRRGRANNASEETQDTLPLYTAHNDEHLGNMPSSQHAVKPNLYHSDADGDTPPGYETREECLSYMPALQRAGELSHCHGAGLVDSLPVGSSSETLIAIAPPPPSDIAEHSNESDNDGEGVDSQRAPSPLDIQLDLQQSVFCKLCRKIHTIAKHPYLSWELRLVRLDDGKCPLSWQTVDLGHGIQLGFWFVYLIMRAQRLSPAHGLSLSDAAFTVSGPGLRHRRIAPLVGKGNRAGHLLLRIRSTFMFSCEDVANLAISGELHTCRHQRRSKYFGKMCKDAAKLALQTRGSEKVLVQLRKCSACSSEYELTMVNKAKHPCQMEMRRNPIFYTVLEHFIDIGECEDNTSAEWVGLRYDGASNLQVKLKKISEKASLKEQFEGQKTVKGKQQKFGERVDRIRYLHKMAGPIP